VSVTRLHIRRFWSYPGFLLYALASSRQARRAAGFHTGWLTTDREWGFWTATVWTDVDAMRAFRNSGTHMKAMPRLLRWCDEASYVHWEQEDATAPAAELAYDRLARDGKLSKVLAPSARQVAGQRVGGAMPPRGQQLQPIR